MKVSISELANLVDGQLTGDPTTCVSAARPLGVAGPGDISFVEGAKHVDDLRKSSAGAVIAPLALEHEGIPVIRVADPLAAFVMVFQRLNGILPQHPTGIDPRAIVAPSASIGTDPTIHPLAQIGDGTIVGSRCEIGPGAVIGRNCRLGDDVTIHANAVLYDRTSTGDRVVIHAGAVIGADGFGYRTIDGRHVKVPQLGHVELGDDVEIGAGATIDRSTFDVTRIGAGTKIDNLVQVAHNCQIGKHNLFVAQSGIAGSSSTGDYVVLAGQAGVVDHIKIGKGAIVGAQAGVTKDISPGERVLGSPAVPWRDFTHNLWLVSRMGEWRKELQQIRKRLGNTGNS